MGVGQMGLSPKTFDEMTPAQFFYAWIGWRKLQENRMRDSWERERWGTYFQVMVHVDPKRRSELMKLLSLPWDGERNAPSKTLTRDERRERVKELLKHLNHEP